MRVLPSLLCVLSGLALVGPALAQDPDLPGCIRGNPCEVVVVVDAQGIDIDRTEFEEGEWVQYTVFNGDEVEHTLSLESHGVEVTLGPDDITDSEPFEMDARGTFELTDEPTGDVVNLTVVESDRFSGDGSDADDDRSSPIPGPAVAWLLAGLACAALVLRRRR